MNKQRKEKRKKEEKEEKEKKNSPLLTTSSEVSCDLCCPIAKALSGIL
jgi:hypothetical protein